MPVSTCPESRLSRTAGVKLRESGKNVSTEKTFLIPILLSGFEPTTCENFRTVSVRFSKFSETGHSGRSDIIYPTLFCQGRCAPAPAFAPINFSASTNGYRLANILTWLVSFPCFGNPIASRIRLADEFGSKSSVSLYRALRKFSRYTAWIGSFFGG